MPTRLLALLLLLAATFTFADAAKMVRMRSDHTLEVDPAFAKQLLQSSSNTTTPHRVLSVIGPYHSGKSFFLNHLLRNNNAFPVGTTTEPTTRGMDFALMQEDNSTTTTTRWLLVDVEGMSATDSSLKHDAKLFTLAALFSDVLVYNTMRTIDTSSLDMLEMLARRAKLWQLRSNSTTATTTSTTVAELVWVVQAFALQHVKGENATGWLHRVLHQQRSGLANAGVFSHISAATLRAPFATEGEEASSGEVRSEYVRDLEALRAQIVLQHRQETAPRTGKQLLAWLHFLVRVVNNKNGEDEFEIPSIWTGFVESQYVQARREAGRTFQAVFAKESGRAAVVNGGAAASPTTLPLTPQALWHAADTASAAAMSGFDAATTGLTHPQQQHVQRSETQEAVRAQASKAVEEDLERILAVVRLTGEQEFALLEERADAAFFGGGVLPLPSKQLAFQFQALTADMLARWTALCNKYEAAADVVSSSSYTAQLHQERKSLQQRVDLLFVGKWREENLRLWAELAQRAEDDAAAQFLSGVHIPEQQCYSTARLEVLARSANEGAVASFHSHVGRFKQEPDFDARLHSLLYKLTLHRDAQMRRNADCLQVVCAQLAGKAVANLTSALAGIVLPKPHARLVLAVQQAENATLALYSQLLVTEREGGDTLANEQGCRLVDLQVNNAQYQHAVARMMQANVDAIALYFAQPLREAKREAEALTMVSPSLFSNFRQDVAKLGRDKITRLVRARALEQEFDELVQSAVQTWLDTDMDFLIQTRTRQWYQDVAMAVAWSMLMAVVVGGGAAVVGAIGHRRRVQV